MLNKKELIRQATKCLKNDGVRKRICDNKSRFTIADQDGHERIFYVKKSDKTATYTSTDVENVIDACLAVIEDAMMSGETVDIHGYGSIYLQFREEKRTIRPDSGDPIVIPARYTPRFSFGSKLKFAAKIYEMRVRDAGQNIPPPCGTDEESEEIADGD